VKRLVLFWPLAVETRSLHSGGGSRLALRTQGGSVTAGATEPEQSRRKAASGWALTEGDIREIDQTTG
jgi:hypothetical protein